MINEAFPAASQPSSQPFRIASAREIHANNNRSGSDTGEDGVSFTMYKITWVVCLLNSFRYRFAFSSDDSFDSKEEERDEGEESIRRQTEKDEPKY